MRKITTVLMLLTVLCGSVAAGPITTIGLQYTIENDKAILVRNTDTLITNVTVPQSITVDGKSYPVTGIGSFVFFNCSRLETVTLPAGLTIIEDGTFDGCTSLKSIDIPNGVTAIKRNAFSNCRSLESISIPESVTEIGRNAFLNCTSLPVIDGIRYAGPYLLEAVDKDRKSFKVRKGTKWIPDGSFNGCVDMESISIPKSVESIGEYVFASCEKLPVIDGIRYAGPVLIEAVDKYATSYKIRKGTKWIGNWAFDHCLLLESVMIPESVISIGDGSFSWCEELKSIDLPQKLEYIGDGAFGHCISLESVNIPKGVTEISNSLFAHCIGLKEVSIPENVTRIGDNVFFGCESLTSVNIPDKVTFMGFSTFESCTRLPYENDELYIDKWLVNVRDTLKTTLVIREGTRCINKTACYNCRRLTSITIPEGVEYIGSLSFYNSDKIESVYIPNSVTFIGSSAFSPKTRLENLGDGKNMEVHDANAKIVEGDPSWDGITISRYPDGTFKDARLHNWWE